MPDVLHDFLRIVTNHRIFNPPSTMAQAYRFCGQPAGETAVRNLTAWTAALADFS